MREDLGQTSSGLQPAHAAAFAYVFGVITGLIFFFMEKGNRFVRFHAMQSICFSIGVCVLTLVVRMTPLVGGALAVLTQIAACVVWIVLIVKAAKGRWYRLPVFGDIAAKQSGLL